MTGIGQMMYAEAHCIWRKNGECTHAEASSDGKDCPWAKPPDSIVLWYPCMYAEASQ